MFDPPGYFSSNIIELSYIKIDFTNGRAKAYCAARKSTLATIYDEFSQAWAFSMLSDPTENPLSASPGGLIAWLGMKQTKISSGASVYTWISKW